MELDLLVALDNSINHEYSPLHSMAINLKSSHTPYSVLTGIAKWPFCLYLCLESILFFSFFFSKLEHLIHHILATSITMSAI